VEQRFHRQIFLRNLERWLGGQPVAHDSTHVKKFDSKEASGLAAKVGSSVATELLEQKAVLGIFDEGCMGMYNAIIPDELLHPMGIFKERLSQSALYAAMNRVDVEHAQAVRTWLDNKGMKFRTGSDPKTELTDDQILEQCRMYVAAVRIADEFGCAAIGIQYQQGLKDLTPASDWSKGFSTTSIVLRSRKPAPAASSSPAEPCLTSTRWTNAPASMPSLPIAYGRVWGSTLRPRCTTSATEKNTRAICVGV